MKIRTDFVTNSSSSSFVTYKIENDKLLEYLQKLIAEGKVMEFDGRHTWVNNSNVVGTFDIYDNKVTVYIETEAIGNYGLFAY